MRRESARERQSARWRDSGMARWQDGKMARYIYKLERCRVEVWKEAVGGRGLPNLRPLEPAGSTTAVVPAFSARVLRLPFRAFVRII
jgi:hypothetical protein